MSTNNFSYDNILVVLPSFDYDYKKPCNCCNKEDCEFAELDSDFDNIAFDEYIANMQAQLQKIGFDTCDKWDNDRSYSGKIIARQGLEDKTGMIVWVEVVVRNGYYSGQNIDYTIEGDFGIENEQNKKDVVHYEIMHRKLDRLTEKTRKILLKYGGEQYIKTAQFSNGEAMYQKLSPKKQSND